MAQHANEAEDRRSLYDRRQSSDRRQEALPEKNGARNPRSRHEIDALFAELEMRVTAVIRQNEWRIKNDGSGWDKLIVPMPEGFPSLHRMTSVSEPRQGAKTASRSTLPDCAERGIAKHGYPEQTRPA